jgi:putative lipase involved disintegration of autophagic bodies
MKEYPNHNISVTGHSLGGMVADYVSRKIEGIKCETYNKGPTPTYK